MYYPSLSFVTIVLLSLLAVGVVESVSFPSSSSLDNKVEGLWPFSNDGVVNPPSFYQRYRRDEYPTDQPFFQWWYYYFSDFTNDKYYLVAFGIDETHMDTNQKYFAVTFGAVDVKGGVSWHKGERFDLSVINVTNYFDIKAVDSNGDLMYHIEVLDNDTYHLTGSMTHNDALFTCVGIDCDTPVSFDLTLSRINGWYGQQDLEKWQIEFAHGEISWNPYAHNSLVDGKIVVGNDTFPFIHSPQYRGYGDMNWGERFPAGDSVNDGFDFPWGWFTAYAPAEDPTQDFSFVVGVGKEDFGIPLGSVSAAFADFHFNNTHLGIRQINGWDGHEFTLPILMTSSDGELHSFSTNKSNFVTFVEGEFNFSIPLVQTLYFSTTHYNIVLNYTASTSIINRLVFAYGDVYFSDFEGLGALVEIVIDYKDDNGKITNLFDFVQHGAGYEFGYETKQGFSKF